MWDDEVDVVCTGSGVGGLAWAIAAVDAGLEVFVAESSAGLNGSRTLCDPAHLWLGAGVVDPETNDYFAALSADLGPLSAGARDADVSVGVAHDLPPAEPRGTVEPFYGARLKDWAARCTVSPYGVLYTRVANRGTMTMRTRGGEAIEVVVVGSLDPDTGFDADWTLMDWLTAQARDRHLQVAADSPLKRFVFVDDEVAGAVFATPDGPYAVRARHGIAVATSGRTPQTGTGTSSFDEYGTVEVCLVSQTASRFGRIELLTTEPVAQRVRPACGAANRQLHDSLRETGVRSRVRCRREVHRYPPAGQ